MALESDRPTLRDQLSKLQNTSDIPSGDNKVQDGRFGVDGGVSDYQGIFYDQTKEAAKVNLVDKITSGVDIKSLIAIGIGIAVLILILKVSK